MTELCPRCGALRPERLGVRGLLVSQPCPECALAVDPIPLQLGPSDDELTYGLDEWPAGDRAAVTMALDANGIAYRWDLDVVLVVPAAAEEIVDRLLDEVETASAVDGDDELDADSDGGPEAQQAMADLFVLADRLGHHPFDVVAATNLAAATSIVQECAPPFGIDGSVWRDTRMRAAALLAAVAEKEDDDVIVAHARDLRNALRDYI